MISRLTPATHAEARCLSRLAHGASTRTTPSSLAESLLTSGEAAKYLGYKSNRSMENFRYRKVGPPHITLPTGGVRYRQADLDAWIDSSSHLDPGELSYDSFVKRQQAEKRKARDRERKAVQAAQRKARREAGVRP
jgi:hypothetical protein